MPELRGLSYRERLVELNLSTLDYRRKRFDIIQIFKIIHKIDRIDMNVLFPFAENTQLRGHNMKLKKNLRLINQTNSFALRNIPVWNSLPTDTVNSKTVVEFKIKLDKTWQDGRYDMADIYIEFIIYVNLITIQPGPTTSRKKTSKGIISHTGLNDFPYHQQGINKVYT